MNPVAPRPSVLLDDQLAGHRGARRRDDARRRTPRSRQGAVPAMASYRQQAQTSSRHPARARGSRLVLDIDANIPAWAPSPGGWIAIKAATNEEEIQLMKERRLTPTRTKRTPSKQGSASRWRSAKKRAAIKDGRRDRRPSRHRRRFADASRPPTGGAALWGVVLQRRRAATTRKRKVTSWMPYSGDGMEVGGGIRRGAQAREGDSAPHRALRVLESTATPPTSQSRKCDNTAIPATENRKFKETEPTGSSATPTERRAFGTALPTTAGGAGGGRRLRRPSATSSALAVNFRVERSYAKILAMETMRNLQVGYSWNLRRPTGTSAVALMLELLPSSRPPYATRVVSDRAPAAAATSSIAQDA